MSKRILIVDDCSINLLILEELLKNDYELERAETGEECLAKMLCFAPDLILLDIMMPGIGGLETCRRIKEGPMGPFTQVVLVSGKATCRERLEGFEAGADDYVVKPFEHEELLARVRVQFRLRDTLQRLWLADARLREFNAELELAVAERTSEILSIRDTTIFAMAKLAESRDAETGQHLDRMRIYCRMLAQHLSEQGPFVGQIDSQFIDDVWRTSPLHDIGKVGIPDAVLLKPGRLTPEEFEVMKRHTTIGADCIAHAAGQTTFGRFLAMAIDIARYHHERYDGRGYPEGLAGEAIPLAARIVALADVYDALTSARVYKPAFSPDIARSIIDDQSGHFDPAVLEAFRVLEPEFRQVAAQFQTPESIERPIAVVEYSGA